MATLTHHFLRLANFLCTHWQQRNLSRHADKKIKDWIRSAFLINLECYLYLWLFITRVMKSSTPSLASRRRQFENWYLLRSKGYGHKTERIYSFSFACNVPTDKMQILGLWVLTVEMMLHSSKECKLRESYKHPTQICSSVEGVSNYVWYCTLSHG